MTLPPSPTRETEDGPYGAPCSICTSFIIYFYLFFLQIFIRGVLCFPHLSPKFVGAPFGPGALRHVLSLRPGWPAAEPWGRAECARRAPTRAPGIHLPWKASREAARERGPESRPGTPTRLAARACPPESARLAGGAAEPAGGEARRGSGQPRRPDQEAEAAASRLSCCASAACCCCWCCAWPAGALLWGFARMSQWNQVQQLETKFLEQIDHIYDDKFPMEVRHLLAQWIENQDWESAYNNEPMAAILLQNLFIKLEEHLDRVSQEKNLLLIHNLKRIRKLLQGKYQSNPMHMAVVVSNCLREERRILATANMPLQGPLEKSLQNPLVSERQRNTEHKVSAIKNSAQMTDQDVKYLEDLQEEFDFRYKTMQSMEQNDKNNVALKQEMLMLQEMLNTIDFRRKEVLSKMARVIKEMEDLMNNTLMEELLDWKRRQQIACIGGPLHSGLDQLQNCFTLLAESLFQIRRQLEKLDEFLVKLTYEGDSIPLQRPHLLERANFLLYSLFQSSLVVEKQPCMPTHPQRPLVLKTLIQFTVKIRLLIKLPELNYQIKVKAAVDKNASTISSRRFVLCGTHVKAMTMDESANGSLSVEFRHLQPKEMKSCTGNKGIEGSQMVTEELHSISFETQVCLYGLTVDLEASSLPVVMISNVSQLPNAWASIIWYNLSTNEPQNLAFFNNPPSLPLSQLLEVLSWQFSSYVGRGLSADQLSMLAEKLTGQQVIYSDYQLSWSKFCKEHLPGKSFTFWVWLEAILELIKKHILPLWIDGCIMGFVRKEKQRVLLKDKLPGTFLLRFSESNLGGITFTWVYRSESGEEIYHSVEPYNKGRLTALPFADILRDYKVIVADNVSENPLKYLYPDIPKDKAFGKHYSSQPNEVLRPTEGGDKGYVPSVFIPVSKILSDSTDPSSPSDLLPMSPSVYAVLREHLSPTVMETALSSPYSTD